MSNKQNSIHTKKKGSYKKLVIHYPLDKILEDHNIKFKENSSEQLILEKCFNPECGAKKKLYIDKNDGRFICFKCETKGGAVEAIEGALNISKGKAYDLIVPPKSRMISIDSVKGELADLTTGIQREQEKPTDPIEMPKMCRSLKKGDKQAWNYLINRGYSDEVIESLKLMIIPYPPVDDFITGWNFFQEKLELSDEDIGTGKKKEDLSSLQKNNRQDIVTHISGCGRIFFPLYVEGKIHGYLARDYTNGILKDIANKNKRDYVKVLNTQGVAFKSHYVWNYDNAKNTDILVIAEGATSAIKCGINRSIALLGKLATKGQIKLLKTINPKKIVFCLDVGTEKEQEKIKNMFGIAYADKMFTVEMPNIFEFSEDFSKADLEKIEKILNIKIKVLKSNQIEFKQSYILRLRKLRDGKNNGKKISESEKNFIKNWLKKGDFLDPGDYSFEVMDKLIKNAKTMTKKKNKLL